jgi:hypothetical protein
MQSKALTARQWTCFPWGPTRRYITVSDPGSSRSLQFREKTQREGTARRHYTSGGISIVRSAVDQRLKKAQQAGKFESLFQLL